MALSDSELVSAAQRGDIALVRRLLQDPEPPDSLALHAAACCDEAAVIAELLRDHRVDCLARSKNGATVLHHAAASNSLNTLRALAGSSGYSSLVQTTNEWGETPLHLAEAAGHTAAIRLLIDSGADLHAKDSWARTPSQVSKEQHSKETSTEAQPSAVPHVAIEMRSAVQDEPPCKKLPLYVNVNRTPHTLIAVLTLR